MKQRANITWFEAAYSGFVRNALTTIPATSIALLVFEIMRTKLSDNFEDYKKGSELLKKLIENNISVIVSHDKKEKIIKIFNKINN